MLQKSARLPAPHSVDLFIVLLEILLEHATSVSPDEIIALMKKMEHAPNRTNILSGAP
jgi:hypothetical protein